MNNLTFEQQDKEVEDEAKRLAEQLDNGFGEDDLGVGDEEEGFELLSLDPKEWKVCHISSSFLLGISS